jgi:hypothetical protein
VFTETGPPPVTELAQPTRRTFESGFELESGTEFMLFGPVISGEI